MTPPAPETEAAEMQPSTVFVYGTLMPGERYEAVARVADPPTSQERAFLEGYVLYDLHPEGYPALVAAGSTVLPEGSGSSGFSGVGRVRGWLLHYHPAQWPATLAHLDELEGLHLKPPLYNRTLALAQTEGGETKRVWVYLYARSARLEQAGSLHVPSGDWTNTSQQRGGAARPGVGPGDEDATVI